MTGFVSLVGAGPWDPELLTLAGQDRLARADVVIADYLVNPALFVHCRPDADILQRSRGELPGPRLPQDKVNDLLVEHARAGRYVVRLKGGDPMIFGRGAEEARVLREAGIPFEFVPGVTAPIAAPEAAGIPVTHRDHTPSVSFVSGFEAYDKRGLQVAWEHLAQSAGTLVLMMSVKNARANADRLMAAGRSPDTPAAIVRWGTRGIQKTIVGSLEDIADRMEAAGIRAPAVLVVGGVVGEREALTWMERRALFGRRVVVTRAAHQSGKLVRMLAAEGADVALFPCLQVVPPTNLTELRTRLSALANGDYDGAIVSSPNGVDAFFSTLASANMDVRSLAGRTIAAIGTGTARRLREGGLVADLVPDRANSEGLVDLLGKRDLLGARWLHFRGDDGRNLIRDAIGMAKGVYTLATAYRVVRPSPPPLLLASLAPPEDGGEGFDAICFASGKAARHFVETLDEQFGADKTRALLRNTKILALGPVTAESIRALDLQVDGIASSTTDEAMVDVVKWALSEQ